MATKSIRRGRGSEKIKRDRSSGYVITLEKGCIMEIFKIVRNGGVQKNEVSGVGEKQEAEQGYKPSEQEELAEAKQVTGEVPVTSGATGEKEGQSDAPPEEAFSLGKEKTGELLVKVDGPLSQVFTSALNKVLAYENMMIVPLIAEELEQLNDENSYNDVTSIHVQAYDANDLSVADVVDISNSVTKTTGDVQLIAMETLYNQVHNKALGALESYCHSTGIRTSYKMRLAAESILNMARKVGV